MRTLKNLLMFALLPIFALTVGCEQNPNVEENPVVEKDSTITLKESTITMNYGGGSVFVNYSIENPHAGEKISVKAEDSWVGGFDTSYTGAFQMVVEPNDSGAVRQTLVTVSYRYAEDVTFVVKQGTKLNAGFVIENVSAVGEYYSYTVNVLPTDKNTPFIMMSADLFYLSSFPNGGTDEELYDDDMGYFGWLGSYYGESALDVLHARVRVGDQRNLTIGEGTPGMKYVFYAYYVDYETGARLSDIERLEITIMHPDMHELAFEFGYEVDGPSAHTSAVPAQEVENYYFDVISVEEVNWAVGLGYTAEDYIKVWWAQTVVDRIADNYTIDQIIGESTCVGVDEDANPRSQYFYELAAGVDYYIFAFEIDSANALCISTPMYEKFTSGFPEPSDNQLGITIGEVSAYTANLSFTATNNDHYVAGWETAELWATYGSNDAERMEYMMRNIAFEYLHGNVSTLAKGLTPETEYVAYAFGMRGGVATTGLTTKSFTTSSPNAGKVSISMNEEVTYYRPDEIAEYDNIKWGHLASTDYQEKAIVAVEWLFSSPYYRYYTSNCYNWEGYNWEYDDTQYINGLIWNIDQNLITSSTLTYTPILWENRHVWTAMAVDEDGNYSPLYKREIYAVPSKAGKAQEFVDWWEACEENQNSGGLQSLVIEKSSASETPLFRAKSQRFRASQYEASNNNVPEDVETICASR